ncbi:hypothetical protein [Glutamicibacter sp. BW77]|uniref:hypothetical protein n=1 Tax=Glutamicibacter sp. BW77 TaxID=2024402 RepID=UPI000BB7DEA4|nr:hypothetical protein [Glutamicibacter sp. BW77]PCC31445.1 hypothetical protein CIK74_17375 [Glutamicibacter sp. BW77]
MGIISLGHASALDVSGRLHEFKPGEELPDWATGKQPAPNPVAVEIVADPTEDQAALVIASAENDAAGIIAKAQVDAEAILAEARTAAEQDQKDKSDPAEGEGAESAESDENATAEESGEPDFTKPATPKRGRPRKQV